DVNALLRDAQRGAKRWKPAGYQEVKITVDVRPLFRATFGDDALAMASDDSLKVLQVQIPASLLPDPSYQKPTEARNVACARGMLNYPDHGLILPATLSSTSRRTRKRPAGALCTKGSCPPPSSSSSTSRIQAQSSQAVKSSTSRPSSPALSLEVVPALAPSTSHALSPPPPPLLSRNLLILSPSSSPSPPLPSRWPSWVPREQGASTSVPLRPCTSQEPPSSVARRSGGALSSSSAVIHADMGIIDLTSDADDDGTHLSGSELCLTVSGDIIDLTMD
ncbi:hypothetical protein C8T65DRAFT_763662, partial [Cerioporus squamosus]